MKPPSLVASASRPRSVAPVKASATRVTQTFASEQYALRLAMPWQQRALFYSSVIPELQYASNFYARMLQKIKIYPAFRSDDDKTVPITEGEPVRLLNRIQDPGGGRTQLQYRYGQFQFTTGECFLFGRNIGMDEPERWSMVWREELKFDGDRRVTHMLAPQVPMNTYDFNDSNFEELPPGSAEAYRMWTPSLRFSGWPTSPMEGIMQMAEELLKLSSAVEATATSRLVKSKLLFLPQEMEPTPLTADGDEDLASSPWLQDLIAHVQSAIEDPSQAESLGPFVTFMDGELIAMIRDLSLHDPATDYLERDLRIECINRIGRGLDLPPEVVDGMSSANHWAAWWISDDMWRSHGAPRAEQFVDDLNEAYLQPALRDAGFDRWEEVVIDFDASGVVVNPDRSKDADQAFDRGGVGYTGYRIMKNIPEEWAQTPEEHAEFLAKNRVEVDSNGNIVPDSGDANPGDQPGPPAGEPGEVSEGTNLPASAFQGAAELALFRCRELAGSRIRSRRSTCPGCLDEVQHLENSMVASALGAEGLVPLGSPKAQELVAGGADSFKSLLVQWGNDEQSAAAIAKLVETHAARTLLQEKPSVAALASLEMT